MNAGTNALTLPYPQDLLLSLKEDESAFETEAKLFCWSSSYMRWGVLPPAWLHAWSALPGCRSCSSWTVLGFRPWTSMPTSRRRTWPMLEIPSASLARDVFHQYRT